MKRFPNLPKVDLGAYVLDVYRVMPRAVLAGCGWMTWKVTGWYMELDDPSTAQAAFVSVVYGVIPLILNFYLTNGIDWNAKIEAAKSDAPIAPPRVRDQIEQQITVVSPGGAK